MKKQVYLFISLFFYSALHANQESLYHKIGDYTVFSGVVLTAIGIAFYVGDKEWINHRTQNNGAANNRVLHQEILYYLFIPYYLFNGGDDASSQLMTIDQVREWAQRRRKRWKKVIVIGGVVSILGSGILGGNKIYDQFFK